MTRMHFKALAEIIRNENQRAFRTIRNDADSPGDYALVAGTLERVADQIADLCYTQNERFDRERFMTACGF